jgi:imidazole glycerol-phosphate synthase subunit HisF
MPMKRVIAVLVVRHGWVVQSIGFERYLPVGRPEIAARFLSEWGADEIVLADITATAEGRTVDPDMVERTAERCYVPLTVGGGLRTIDDMRSVLRSGADKVLVNTLLIDDIGVIGAAAEVFGNQCLVASIDTRAVEDGWRVFGDSGHRDTGLDPADLAERAMLVGAGEVLLNAIDRDGSRRGYDVALANHVGSRISIPLILAGGAGHPGHLVQALSCEYVAAAAAANFFHFTEHTIAVVKAWLHGNGIPARRDSFADYAHIAIADDDGRIVKRPEDELEREVFEFIPDEVI